MIRPNIELIYSFNYSTGTTVYQGDNRFSLKIFSFENKVEISQKISFLSEHIEQKRTQEIHMSSVYCFKITKL